MKILRAFIRKNCVCAVYDEPFDYPMEFKAKIGPILEQVAREHAVAARAILGRSRIAKNVAARHEFFYRALTETPRGASWIGQRFGFDHTTVLYGAAKHALIFDKPSPTRYNYAKRHAVTA